jgi:hypothetical protein
MKAARSAYQKMISAQKINHAIDERSQPYKTQLHRTIAQMNARLFHLSHRLSVSYFIQI